MNMSERDRWVEREESAWNNEKFHDDGRMFAVLNSREVNYCGCDSILKREALKFKNILKNFKFCNTKNFFYIKFFKTWQENLQQLKTLWFRWKICKKDI